MPFSVFFSPELDFTTKFMSFICIAAIVLELGYVILPRTFQKMIENWDMNSALMTGSGSMSAALASLAVLCIMISSKFSAIQYAKEHKATETLPEREFRHRNAFLSDMHIYQMVMVCGCLFSLNFLMRLNRDHDKAKDYVQDVKKEVAKAVSDKKND